MALTTHQPSSGAKRCAACLTQDESDSPRGGYLPLGLRCMQLRLCTFLPGSLRTRLKKKIGQIKTALGVPRRAAADARKKVKSKNKVATYRWRSCIPLLAPSNRPKCDICQAGDRRVRRSTLPPFPSCVWSPSMMSWLLIRT